MNDESLLYSIYKFTGLHDQNCPDLLPALILLFSLGAGPKSAPEKSIISPILLDQNPKLTFRLFPLLLLFPTLIFHTTPWIIQEIGCSGIVKVGYFGCAFLWFTFFVLLTLCFPAG